MPMDEAEGPSLGEACTQVGKAVFQTTPAKNISVENSRLSPTYREP